MKKHKKRANKVVKSLVSPIDNFLKLETSSGILLILFTIVALVWANSSVRESYEHFIHYNISFSFGDWTLAKGLQHWVNDGLMVIFFFVVGLEIKRELIIGELSTAKKAALPMFAALGGMIAPALLYTYFNYGEAGESGWGIPMATDIAFAVGILTLMNKKVPFSLKVFLLALAIVDDLGAVLVIAIFYTEQIVGSALGTALVASILISILSFSGVRKISIYLSLAVVLWLSILQSGVHATIAGVILGFLTPIEPFVDKEDTLKEIDNLAKKVSEGLAGAAEPGVQELDGTQIKNLKALRGKIVEIEPPLERLIHSLHPWVSYLIMPVFALVNAGVHIESFVFSEFIANHISLGIIFGLLVGKPLGVLLFSFIAIKMNIARLPRNVSWYQMTCVGILSGIGFTMAIFVSNLALKVPDLNSFSKLGILTASFTASIIGLIMLFLMKDTKKS